MGAKSLPPGDARKIANSAASFLGATFGFELGVVTHLPHGAMKITIIVPFEGKAEALKLTDTNGMLLEATVTPFEGRVK